MARRPALYVRTFLNRRGHASVAYVYAEFSHDDAHPFVTIGDCSRQVQLTFGRLTESERQNSIAKARQLEKVFGQIREFLEEHPYKNPYTQDDALVAPR